jgi:hypothetical protein
MDQTGVVKTIFEGKTEGRRKVERLRFKWMEETENDLRELKVKRWKKGTIMKNGHLS